MKLLKSIVGWMLWNVPLGRFAPKLMGFYLGSKPLKRVGDKHEEM